MRWGGEFGTGTCLECNKEFVHRTTDRRRKYCDNRCSVAFRKTADPEHFRSIGRRADLKHLYGLTKEQFDSMIQAQGGACAICRKPFPATPAVDHDRSCCPDDRTCGKCVRGLLCASCNTKLGWFERRTDIINSYLGRTP